MHSLLQNMRRRQVEASLPSKHVPKKPAPERAKRVSKKKRRPTNVRSVASVGPKSLEAMVADSMARHGSEAMKPSIEAIKKLADLEDQVFQHRLETKDIQDRIEVTLKEYEKSGGKKLDSTLVQAKVESILSKCVALSSDRDAALQSLGQFFQNSKQQVESEGVYISNRVDPSKSEAIVGQTMRKVGRDQKKLKVLSEAIFSKFQESEADLCAELQREQCRAAKAVTDMKQMKKSFDEGMKQQQDMERRNCDLTKKVQKLSSSIAEQKKRHKTETDKLSADISRISDENGALQNKLSTKDAEFEKKFRSIEMQLDIEKKNSTKARKEADDANRSFEDLKVKTAGAESAIKELEKERDSARTKAQQIEKRAEKLSSELDGATKERDEALIRVTSSNNELERVKKESAEAFASSQAAAESRAKESEAAFQQMKASLEEQVTALKKEREESAAHASEAHTEELKRLNKAHEAALKAMGDECESKLERAKAEAEKDVEAAQKKAREEVERDRLNASKSEDKHEKVVKELKDKLSASEAEVRKLERKVAEGASFGVGSESASDALAKISSDAISNEEARHLQEQIDALTSEIQDGVAERDRIRKKDAEMIAALQQNASAYEKALKECGINPQSITRTADAGEAFAGSSPSDLKRLKEELKTARSELVHSREELANARLEIASLEGELAHESEIKSSAPPIEPSPQNLRKYSRRVSEIQTLQSNRRQSLRMIIDMKSDIKSMRGEADKKIKRLEDERDYFKAQLEEMKRAVQERAEGNLLFLSVLNERNFGESIDMIGKLVVAAQSTMKRRKPRDAIEDVQVHLTKINTMVLPRLIRVQKNFRRTMIKWEKMKKKILRASALMGLKPSVVTAKMCPTCGHNPFMNEHAHSSSDPAENSRRASSMANAVALAASRSAARRASKSLPDMVRMMERKKLKSKTKFPSLDPFHFQQTSQSMVASTSAPALTSFAAVAEGAKSLGPNAFRKKKKVAMASQGPNSYRLRKSRPRRQISMVLAGALSVNNK